MVPSMEVSQRLDVKGGDTDPFSMADHAHYSVDPSWVMRLDFEDQSGMFHVAGAEKFFQGGERFFGSISRTILEVAVPHITPKLLGKNTVALRRTVQCAVVKDDGNIVTGKMDVGLDATCILHSRNT